MNERERKYADLASTGWVMMFLIFLAMFVIDLTKSAIAIDFAKWSHDPGNGGLKVLIIVMLFYAFMPVLIKMTNARWFKFVAIGLAVFFTLFFIAHQLTHIVAGDKPTGLMSLLDIAHHILGVIVIYASIGWLRSGIEKVDPN